MVHSMLVCNKYGKEGSFTYSIPTPATRNEHLHKAILATCNTSVMAVKEVLKESVSSSMHKLACHCPYAENLRYICDEWICLFLHRCFAYPPCSHVYRLWVLMDSSGGYGVWTIPRGKYVLYQ